MSTGNEVFYHVCKKCIDENPGSSCCRGSSVPLTVKDIERITALGHNPEDFVIAGEYGREFVEGYEKWWVDSFLKHGEFYYKTNTRTRENGECVFLKHGVGCTLGEHRPAVCRMYPFWVNEEGHIVYEPDERESCYIPRKKYSVDEGLEMLGEDKDRVTSFFREIKHDCENNHEAHALVLRPRLPDRADLRPALAPLTSCGKS